MPTLRKTISGRLSKARARRGLSQTDLAKLTGLNPAAVSHFESGNRLPSCANLQKLADALEVSIDEIFGRASTGLRPAESPILSKIVALVGGMTRRDQQTLADLSAVIVAKYAEKPLPAGCTGE